MSFYFMYTNYMSFYFILNNAGFKNVNTACCGLGNLNAEITCSPSTKYCSNRNEYIFWDNIHLTEKAHHIFVDFMYNGTSPNTLPMNLEKLAHVYVN